MGYLGQEPDGGGGGAFTTTALDNTDSAYTPTTYGGHTYICDMSTSGLSIELQEAATAGDGAHLRIKDNGSAATNNLVINGNGAELIDSANTLTISTNYASYDLVCDASKWHVV